MQTEARNAASRKWKKANPTAQAEYRAKTPGYAALKLRESRAANKEHSKAVRLAWYATKPPDYCAKLTLKHTHAKQEKLAGRLRAKQCEACGSFGRNGNQICFDHCHNSNEFRGWLCHNCNSVLGLVHDAPDTLIKLAKYLRKFEKKKKAV